MAGNVESRNAEICALERLAARHWRGAEEHAMGGWLLRAARGFTGRANSALAAGDPGMPLDDALAAVAAWYRGRGLPPMIAVPVPLPYAQGPAAGLDAALAARSWTPREGDALVMTARAGLVAGYPELPPGLSAQAAPEPDDAWLARYHYRGRELPPAARDVLVSAPWQAFLSICDPGGTPVAIARVSVASGWAGITAVEVAPALRRQGLGVAITRTACATAARQGAEQVFLQVAVGNAAARALYGRCGFGYSHWYRYRIAPAAAGPAEPV